jgi:hypothetical protein
MSLADSEFDDAGFGDVGLDQPVEGPADDTQATPSAPAAPNYRKQGFSIYTVMLILSFVFLLTAMILLFMEVDRLG